MNDLGYFLLGLVSEKLNLRQQSKPTQGQPAESGTRVLASYEVSNADQIAAAMQAPAVAQPEPEQFDAILLLAHGTPDVLSEMDALLPAP